MHIHVLRIPTYQGRWYGMRGHTAWETKAEAKEHGCVKTMSGETKIGDASDLFGDLPPWGLTSTGGEGGRQARPVSWPLNGQ